VKCGVVYQTVRSDWKPGEAVTVSAVDPLALPPALSSAWDELAAHASEPNAFAERWCLAPALQLLDGDRSARLLVVEVGGELIGIAPVATARRYGPLPLPHWTNWRHPNHFHGAPLVRAGQEIPFWQAMIDWCSAQRPRAPLLQWRQLTASSPLHRALEVVTRARQVHHEVRALLASDLGPDAYWEAAVRGKKRKELRRQANRLSESGALDQRHWQPGEPVEPWVDAFVTLEAASWKGREGSALGSDPGTEAWLRTIIPGARDAGRLDMRMLAQNGRPLAMLINFLCPPGGFSFKTAFAEDAARFSPGVLLQQANLALLDRSDLAWVDSCAAPDHPMIDSIWRERRELIWVNIPLGGRWSALQFAALMRAEALWHRLRRRPATPAPAPQDDAA
jgi:CelD/BcsL family acetyltransferase involved in cellulose biosynthesis